MNNQPLQHRWAPRIALVGLLAVGAAWGLNQLAIWQLEQLAPEPERGVVHAELTPPWPEAPSVDGELVVEQVVEEAVVEEAVVDAPVPEPDETIDVQRKVASSETSSSKTSPNSKSSRAKSPTNKPSTNQPLTNKPSASNQAPEMRVFAIDTKRLERQFKRPEDVEGHGRVLPNVKDGRRLGLKVIDVAPGGLFARLGIESGDVILSVNGTKITTQQKALADFEKMRKLRTFDVVLERRGNPRHHRYVLK